MGERTEKGGFPVKKYALTPAEALELGLAQPYAYITRLSRVTVGPTPAQCPLEELLEARFFGPDREVRIYSGEEGLEAVCLEDEEQEDYLTSTCTVRDTRFGKYLTLRRYLGYDEDGQAYIQATRLADWKGDAQ